jgi:hypothetical protein
MVGAYNPVDAQLFADTSDPFGTIVHPSVFLELDINPRVYESSRLRGYRVRLGMFREESLAEGQAIPWISDSTFNEIGVSAFRILVCGKTGVGKSTLINCVFGVDMVTQRCLESDFANILDRGANGFVTRRPRYRRSFQFP